MRLITIVVLNMWLNGSMILCKNILFGKERYLNERAKKTNECNNKAWFNETYVIMQGDCLTGIETLFLEIDQMKTGLHI